MSKRVAAAAIAIGAIGITGLLAYADKDIGDPPQDFLDQGFNRRELETPAGRMNLYEAGRGQPLLFLHGIGGGASAWTWVFVAPDLSADFRVIVPDWIGWGLSEHPARYIGFDDYVSSLEALLDDVGPAIIVCQSLACGFAAALAERRPELVKRLVMHTPAGGKDLGTESFGPLARTTLTPFASLSGVRTAFYKALFHRRLFISGWLRQEGFNNAEAVTDRIINGFLYSARKPKAFYSALPFATGDLRYDFAPFLRRIQVPASMFWGAQETQVGQKVRKGFSELRPDIPLTLIKEAKACPELEQPGRVIELVRAAVDKENMGKAC